MCLPIWLFNFHQGSLLRRSHVSKRLPLFESVLKSSKANTCLPKRRNRPLPIVYARTTEEFPLSPLETSSSHPSCGQPTSDPGQFPKLSLLLLGFSFLPSIQGCCWYPVTRFPRRIAEAKLKRLQDVRVTGWADQWLPLRTASVSSSCRWW